MTFQLETPVALFMYKRPDSTRQVLNAIAAVRPSQLFVIADGPRNEQDAEKCKEVRTLIEQVDWDCKIVTNYSDINLGLKQRVSSGLNWLFERVPEAIILEDDCVAHPSFFRFCQELLDKYRTVPEVMHISGNNFLQAPITLDSYYFTRYPHVWGWATWKRAWKYYDIALTEWKNVSNPSLYLDKFEQAREKFFWMKTWNNECSGRINTWDYQWSFACLAQNGLSIAPASNLVINIGFGIEATHTKRESVISENMKLEGLSFPLKHPSKVSRNVQADLVDAQQWFYLPTIYQRIRRKLLSIIHFVLSNIKYKY